jgi:hypothetical protein
VQFALKILVKFKGKEQAAGCATALATYTQTHAQTHTRKATDLKSLACAGFTWLRGPQHGVEDGVINVFATGQRKDGDLPITLSRAYRIGSVKQMNYEQKKTFEHARKQRSSNFINFRGNKAAEFGQDNGGAKVD